MLRRLSYFLPTIIMKNPIKSIQDKIRLTYIKAQRKLGLNANVFLEYSKGSGNDFDLGQYPKEAQKLVQSLTLQHKDIDIWLRKPKGIPAYIRKDFDKKWNAFHEKFGKYQTTCKTLPELLTAVYLDNTKKAITTQDIQKIVEIFSNSLVKKLKKTERHESFSSFSKKIRLILQTCQFHLQVLLQNSHMNKTKTELIRIPFATWIQDSEHGAIHIHTKFIYGDIIIMQDGSWYFVGYRNIYDLWDTNVIFWNLFKKETYDREWLTLATKILGWGGNITYSFLTRKMPTGPQDYHVYCFNPLHYKSPIQSIKINNQEKTN